MVCHLGCQPSQVANYLLAESLFTMLIPHCRLVPPWVGNALSLCQRRVNTSEEPTVTPGGQGMPTGSLLLPSLWLAIAVANCGS